MTSPEKEREQNKKEEEKVPDLQQSFVFGNTYVKPPTRARITPEDAEPRNLFKYRLEDMLCLSRTNLKHIPDSVFTNSKLTCLYLERNQISHVPESLFTSLPNLLWLDLRSNHIETLPAEIGSHRRLETLLLEYNPISELPAELGYVITLTGLSLRECPITSPPQDILDQGVQGILQYLRSRLTKRPISVRKTPPAPGVDAADVPAVELPPVEKLQLSELMGSSVEEQEESVDDEEELQRFRELKQKMILLDKAELEPTGQRDRKPRPLPVIRRKKATGKAGIIPELPQFDTQHWRRPEERRQAAMTELKEKQAILEHRRNSQEALRLRGSQVRLNRPKKPSKPRNQEEADSDSKAGGEHRGGSLQSQASCMTITECEESSFARELERQIRGRVEMLQERRRNPKGSSSGQNMEEMRKLQTRLLERKTNRDRNLERRFTIFTADSWPNHLQN